jgi:cobalt-zinc-cadmium resistance protein CzcA
MSFGGLAIAIGMMVDGTIVVVENIDRKLRELAPQPPKGGAETLLLAKTPPLGGWGAKLKIVMEASYEVVKPVVFAISIIIIVFIPLFSLQGVEGKTFKPLAYTIVFAMLGSLIFAVLLAPMFSSFLMKSPKKKENTTESIIFKFKNSLLDLYAKLLSLFIKFRGLSIVLGVILVLLGGFLFTKLGTEFTPKLKEGNLMVRLTLSPSISLEESMRVTTLVEKRLLTIKQIKKVVTRIGRGEVGAHADPINSAEMYILLDESGGIVNSKIQDKVEDKIRKTLKGVPGVVVNITQPIESGIDELLEGVKAELSVKLFGDDLDKLKENAEKISKVLKTVRGAQDIQVDQVSGAFQLVITPNREKMSRYGINMEDVQDTIKIAIGGQSVGKIFEGVKSFDIFVRYKRSERKDKESIEKLIIRTEDGVNIPLKEIADIDEVSGYRQITRENNQRFITIQCNVHDRDIGSFVKEASEKIDEEVDLPIGYFPVWGGQFKLQQEANKRLLVVIPITLLIISLLLFLSFNSIKNTVLILLNIPLALVGGVVALWLTDQNLSVPATVGFIALFGIALENGMVLVTYLNKLVSDGMEVNKASIEGAKLRIKPVLMTAVTTGLGLIPLLISTSTGSEVQKPLATVVVGGLITSTILTLVVIPSLYKWFSDKNNRKLSGVSL